MRIGDRHGREPRGPFERQVGMALRVLLHLRIVRGRARPARQTTTAAAATTATTAANTAATTAAANASTSAPAPAAAAATAAEPLLP